MVMLRVLVLVLLLAVPWWGLRRLLLLWWLLLLVLLLLPLLLLGLKGGGGQGAPLDGRQDTLLVETDAPGAGPRPVAFDLKVGLEGGREGGR